MKPTQNFKSEQNVIAGVIRKYGLADAIAMIHGNVYIAGGAVLSSFTGMKVNDVDLYCDNPSTIRSMRAALIKCGYKLECETINSYTFTKDKKVVQLITRFHGDPETVLSYFDFTVTQALYDIRTGLFYFGDRFFGDLAKREIVFTSTSIYPICSLYRTIKYREKGFEVKGYTLMLLALAIARLEMKTYKELKEQLMGVDTMLLQGIFKDETNFREDLPIDYGKFVEAVFREKDLV